MKRWQWTWLLTVLVGGSLILSIYKTEFLAGFWGLKDDQIAVVKIKGAEDSELSLPSISVVSPSKSFWDVLELLGVPLVLVVLGARFQTSQQEQSDRIAKEQQSRSERIAKEQREQDADDTREEVLQLYFDRISTLLIDNNLMAIAASRESEERLGDWSVEMQELDSRRRELLEVSIDIIRARTLSILRRFEQDSERKSSVIRFLIEADVVARLRLSFLRADLRNVDLSEAELEEADLSGANLSEANLSKAILHFTNLSGTNLERAKLVAADLHKANLSEASLIGANLNAALLYKADLSGANLNGVNLIRAELEEADLFGANLREADFREADSQKS